jgi:Glycosyltransferase 61
VGSLEVRLVKNSVVYPTIRVASHPGKLLMGIYDENDEYVEDTVLERRSGEQGAPVPRDLFPVVTDSDAAEAIYAGPLYYHFGHFLLESLARAWYAQQHPDVPFVWAGAHTWQGFELTQWQLEILDILEIENPTGIIADPARFELLHVPDIGYRYDDRFHPEHAEFLGRYEGPAQLRHHRLWLSRSKTGGKVRDLNSEPTERRLAHAGWTVAYPEMLSIREQLDHLARAEIVAGEEGSAFHALILLKDVSSKKFQIIRRHGLEHPNMHTIGDARQVDQSFYSLEREWVLRAQGRVVSKLTPNSSEILDILDVRVPAAADPATVPPDEAILEQALANFEPRSFLDVGARSPHLVVGSTAAIRVAVSQSFDFDPRSYAASGIDFYELGLTRYANLYHEDRGQFDVIRVTGSEFARVMAAFRVSRRLAHEDTTWILGSGDLAARVALAIRLTHPGFAVRRLFVQRRTVYVAQRVPGEPRNEAAVGELSAEEVKRRIRWIRPAGLRRMRRPKTVA